MSDLKSLKGTALSNMACASTGFAPLRITMRGAAYASVEAAYQAAKTLDPDQRARIAAARSPYDAKKLGRGVTLRADWEDVKLDVMTGLLAVKFRVPAYRAALNATSGTIMEGNGWHDNFWGSCTCPRCAGTGRNELGQLLMRLRD